MPSLTRILVENCEIHARKSTDGIKGAPSAHTSGGGGDGEEGMAATVLVGAVAEAASSSIVPTGTHPTCLLPQDSTLTISSSASSHPVENSNFRNHCVSAKSPQRTTAKREGSRKGRSEKKSSTTNAYQKYYPASPPEQHELWHVANKGSARKGGHHLRKTRFVPAPPSTILRHQGGYYSITSSNSIQTRCTCFRYRPGGGDGSANSTSSGTTEKATTFFWTDYKRARAMNPSAKPIRCPGVLIVKNKTNEHVITIAHECTQASSSTTTIE